VEVQEVPEPRAGANEVVIQVDSAGVCGTDLHIYLDEFPTEPPVTLGHEFAGTISEVGSGVQEWKSGDRVTSSIYFSTCRDRVLRRRPCGGVDPEVPQKRCPILPDGLVRETDSF
jgi:L-iditol 2-dehydrogenase